MAFLTSSSWMWARHTFVLACDLILTHALINPQFLLLHFCCSKALDAADKDRALRALARVTTKPLISKTLEYALSPAVRTQDVSVLLVRLGKQGGLGFNMTWQFVIDRADDILKKYGGKLIGRWWWDASVFVAR